MQGTVKFFNEQRFFGFLIFEDKDLFFHGSDFLGNSASLREGSRVEFQQAEDEKTGRLRAVKVKVIEE